MPAVIIFVGPSAIGKSFAANLLMDTFPTQFARVRVYTTRQKRASESSTSDRVFVPAEEFDQMSQRGGFSVSEYFAGNRYGIRRSDLKPRGHHLIVDAPPRWLPQFLKVQNVVVVGMQAPVDYWPLLDGRMKVRGDSLSVRNMRRSHIETDMHDLERMSMLIDTHGKTFYVKDDRTIPDVIIPWIIQKLDLPVPA